jgi:hypothetical protein
MRGFEYLIQALERPWALIGLLTVIGYAIGILFILLPGWVLAGKVTRGSLRILLRSGVAAMVFAPGILMDPAVTFVQFVPALLAITAYVLMGFPEIAVELGLLPLIVLGLPLWFMIFIVALGVYVDRIRANRSSAA